MTGDPGLMLAVTRLDSWAETMKKLLAAVLRHAQRQETKLRALGKNKRDHFACNQVLTELDD